MKPAMPGRIVPPVLWMAVLFVLSHQPDIPGPALVPDKLLHAGAFGLLAVLLLRGFRRGTYPLTATAMLAAVAVTALYGALDEYHQSFVAGRVPSWGDFAADVAGAIVAVTLAWAWGARRSSTAEGERP